MKVIVVDDHPLILTALAQLAPALGRQVTMIGAVDRDAAYAQLAAHPDCALLLLDLALPGIRGFELLADLRRDFPRLPVAVLSATHDRATVDAAYAAGAKGYIAKTASGDQLVAAVRRLLDGRSCPRPELARSTSPIRLAEIAMLGLTQRQDQVLRLLAQGKPNKLICRDLGLSEGTVKVHVSAILRALNVHTRAQVIAELARRGVAVDAHGRRAH
jgi:DNA-binding NarL/FixJ family response regulator